MSIHDGAGLCFVVGMILAGASMIKSVTWPALACGVLIEGLGGLLLIGGK